MKKIFVLKHRIQKNIKNGNDMLPVIRCLDGEHVIEAHNMEIIKDGEVIAQIVYKPDEPIKGGSTVWIETDLEVRKK